MDVNVRFVIPKDIADESACSEDMLHCFKLCREHGIESSWIKEAQCGDFEWRKQDVVIFQLFEGNAFEKLSKNKCVVLGPRCLLACIEQNKSIPNTLPPIYTTGMMDFTVTCTGISISRKIQIKEKLEYMGAVYEPVLTLRTTHLITNSVKTDKYVKASEVKIPVMLDTWVEEVWRENLTNIVSGDSKQFDKHRCPVFHNLQITSTGFMKERKEIADLVNNNGGMYSGKFKSESTSIVIYCDTQTEKFKAALRSNIDCVTIDWLKDSVKCGYALSIDRYKYKKNLSSTLINPADSNNHLEFSLMSSKIINETDVSVNSVAETHVNFTNLSIASQKQPHTKEPQGTLLNQIIDSIDMKQVKEAGIFLDGCSVYLSGFAGQSRDKLCKVLNSGGATRYDVISDRVTHVIVGNAESDDMFQFETQGLNPTFVSVDWLIESIKLKHVAPEFEFKVSHNTQETLSMDLLSSPLSKKGMQLLRKERKVQGTSSNLDDSTMKVDIMQQYLTVNEGSTGDTLNKFLAKGHIQTATTSAELNSNSDRNSTTIKFDENEQRPEITDVNLKPGIENNDENSEVSTQDSSCSNIFSGLSFFLLNWDDIGGKTELIEIIENHDGRIVCDRDSCSYVVVVHSIPLDDFDEKFINELWLEECIYSDVKVAINYYHRPVKIRSDAKPLAGLVICVSKYVTYERIFLQWLINHLGAISQDKLARKGTQLKDEAIPSTHLLCPEPSGTKYIAAKKWGIPVITCDWIIACSERQAYVPEENYTVERSIKRTNVVVQDEVKNSAVDEMIEVSKKKAKLESRESVQTPTGTCKKTPGKSSFCFTDTMPKGTTSKREESPRTPKNVPRNSLPGSQMTPVVKFLEGLGVTGNSTNTPDQSPLLHTPSHVDTPESPLGRVFGNPNPSPNTRKYWAKKIDSLVPYPYRNYTPRPQTPDTPLSEIKRGYWKRVLPAKCFANEQNDENTDSAKNEVTPSSSIVNDQLQELKNMLTKSDGKKPCRRSLIRNNTALINQFSEDIETNDRNDIKPSQTDTIGWDEPLENEHNKEVDEPRQTVYKFMLSQISIEDRNDLVEKIQLLGGSISDIPNFFDDTATHLLCSVPSRNEKLLSSIASGKWILHSSFLDHCIKSGRFTNEEMFEYGNPLALPAVQKLSEGNVSLLAAAAYRWRKRIVETGKKAYHGMKAIILVSTNRQDPIIRLIEAGDGTVIDSTPPYAEVLGATHCFIESKRLSEFPDVEEIARQGVPCLPHLYLSNYLLMDPQPDPLNCVLEPFKGFYKYA